MCEFVPGVGPQPRLVNGIRTRPLPPSSMYRGNNVLKVAVIHQASLRDGPSAVKQLHMSGAGTSSRTS